MHSYVARNPLGVQRRANLKCGLSGVEILVAAAHDRGPIQIDLTQTIDRLAKGVERSDLVIAVGHKPDIHPFAAVSSRLRLVLDAFCLMYCWFCTALKASSISVTNPSTTVQSKNTQS